MHCGTEAAAPDPPAVQVAQLGPQRFGLLRVSSHAPPAVQYAKPDGQHRPSVVEPGRMLQPSPVQQPEPDVQVDPLPLQT